MTRPKPNKISLKEASSSIAKPGFIITTSIDQWDKLLEEALRELNIEKRVVHTETRPHIYSLLQEELEDETANRNSSNDLRIAETVLTQIELSYTEEAESDHN